MDKLQFVLRGPDRMTHAAFCDRLRDALVPALLARRPTGLKLTWTASRPPLLSMVPLRRTKLALVSLWAAGDIAGDAASGWLEPLGAGGAVLGGYRVEESVPVGYDRTWPDGTPTPGAGLLTLLRRNPRLAPDDFMREWFDRHTPMSLRIHPLWSYVRNVVAEPVVDWSPGFDGIVEEHFRRRGDLLNPARFFGGPLRMLPHMIEVGRHVNRFIDLSTIETYLVDELWIRTPEGG